MKKRNGSNFDRDIDRERYREHVRIQLMDPRGAGVSMLRIFQFQLWSTGAARLSQRSQGVNWAFLLRLLQSRHLNRSIVKTHLDSGASGAALK